MAKHYNIKGAASFIEKAIGIVSDYDRYAEQAGVCGFWRNRIKEEIGYRIDHISG